ncbi:unnamed protein product [Ambrosiozyma monospora]|uniref:Unnamed protein product n=1 Tax=Ambrosiozyma monospora TaxID=43982 RepID=A0ACB5SW36_AMBMO|nr:unnamed protein product [Ambrosiozyma monospora]
MLTESPLGYKNRDLITSSNIYASSDLDSRKTSVVSTKDSDAITFVEVEDEDQDNEGDESNDPNGSAGAGDKAKDGDTVNKRSKIRNLFNSYKPAFSSSTEPPAKLRTMLITTFGRCLLFSETHDRTKPKYELTTEVDLTNINIQFKEVVENRKSGGLKNLNQLQGIFAIMSRSITLAMEADRIDVSSWTNSLAKARLGEQERRLRSLMADDPSGSAGMRTGGEAALSAATLANNNNNNNNSKRGGLGGANSARSSPVLFNSSYNQDSSAGDNSPLSGAHDKNHKHKHKQLPPVPPKPGSRKPPPVTVPSQSRSGQPSPVQQQLSAFPSSMRTPSSGSGSDGKGQKSHKRVGSSSNANTSSASNGGGHNILKKHSYLHVRHHSNGGSNTTSSHSRKPSSGSHHSRSQANSPVLQQQAAFISTSSSAHNNSYDNSNTNYAGLGLSSSSDDKNTASGNRPSKQDTEAIARRVLSNNSPMINAAISKAISNAGAGSGLASGNRGGSGTTSGSGSSDARMSARLVTGMNSKFLARAKRSKERRRDLS